MAVLLRQTICTVGSLRMVIEERESPVVLPILAKAVDGREDLFGDSPPQLPDNDLQGRRRKAAMVTGTLNDGTAGMA
jgi:hypothetical protein